MDAEDVLSGVWEPLMRALKRGQPDGTTDLEITAYLRRAVRNHALNFLRARRQQPAAADRTIQVAGAEGDDRLDALQCPELSPEQRAVLEAVIRRIDEWAPQDRFLFFEKLHGVPSAEIKKALEAEPFRVFLAVATIDTRYHRLQHRLRTSLESQP